MQDLVNNGALVALCNRIGECPLDKSHEQLARILEGALGTKRDNWMSLLCCLLMWTCLRVSDRAIKLDQNMERIPFKDRSWLGYKTRSRKCLGITILRSYPSATTCCSLIIVSVCTGDATLSRHSGIDLTQLNLTSRLSSGHSGEVSAVWCRQSWPYTTTTTDLVVVLLHVTLTVCRSGAGCGRITRS